MSMEMQDVLSGKKPGAKKTRVIQITSAKPEDQRVSAKTAGYMELEGAQKDSDCELVNVRGGVSSEKGCCNLFDPHLHADNFHCDDCVHILTSEQDDEEEE